MWRWWFQRADDDKRWWATFRPPRCAVQRRGAWHYPWRDTVVAQWLLALACGMCAVLVCVDSGSGWWWGIQRSDASMRGRDSGNRVIAVAGR